jgi:hypothetical protein
MIDSLCGSYRAPWDGEMTTFMFHFAEEIIMCLDLDGACHSLNAIAVITEPETEKFTLIS